KQDYKSTLASVLDDAGKMSAVITGLVDLAQADLQFASSQLSAVRLDEVLWTLQEEWKQKEGLELIIKMENLPEQGADLTIPANLVLLQIALNNIISNGFKFSDQQAVICLLQVQEKELLLSFTDH